MSEQSYDRQMITQYLLGSLPEAETERFDDLSITDDQFADALQAAEKDLVDSYVQGELTDAEFERFKSHYLASPLRREKVKFAQAFQDWAKTTVVTEVRVQSPDTTPGKRTRSGWSVLGIFRSPRLAWQWGFVAAALVLFVAGGLIVVQNLRLRQRMTQTQAMHDELRQRAQELQNEIEAQRSTNAKTEQELARLRDERERLEEELKKAQVGVKPPAEGSILAVILAPPLRGTGQLPTVSVKPGTSVVKMQLQLEAADYSAYRVALIDPANNQILWRSGNLKPRTRDERKAIAVSLSADLFKRQNYILRVAGIPGSGGSEIVSDYSFKVVK